MASLLTPALAKTSVDVGMNVVIVSVGLSSVVSVLGFGGGVLG